MSGLDAWQRQQGGSTLDARARPGRSSHALASTTRLPLSILGHLRKHSLCRDNERGRYAGDGGTPLSPPLLSGDGARFRIRGLEPSFSVFNIRPAATAIKGCPGAQAVLSAQMARVDGHVGQRLGDTA